MAATLPAAAQPASGTAASTGAQGNSEERRTRLFKEGKAAADAGQWAEAATRFRQVVAIRSAPKALIALGVAEERLGRLVEAHATYRRAREEAADQALADDLKTANAALEAIRPRLPRVTFTGGDGLAGARLEVDGVQVRADDGFVYVNPGEHTVAATSAAGGTFRVAVSLTEGQQHEVEVVFGAAAAPSGSASSPGLPPDARSSATPPTGAVLVGGAGVIALVAGSVLWSAGSDQYAASDVQCPGPTCSQEVASTGNAGRTQMIAATALFGIGGAALAGGAVWWIVSATSPKKPAGATLMVAPRVGGLTVSGRF